jgi:hypothetical protein
MTEIKATIDQVINILKRLDAAGIPWYVVVNVSLDNIPTPEPEPKPHPTKIFMVTENVANARCVYGTNKSGKPIMGIYPKGGEVNERIHWAKGKSLPILPDAITADGGGRYYQVFLDFGFTPEDGYLELYVRSEDGGLI